MKGIKKTVLHLVIEKNALMFFKTTIQKEFLDLNEICNECVNGYGMQFARNAE